MEKEKEIPEAVISFGKHGQTRGDVYITPDGFKRLFGVEPRENEVYHIDLTSLSLISIWCCLTVEK